MNEDLLLAASLSSREAFEQALSLGCFDKQLNDSAAVLVKLARDQYNRDRSLKAADMSVLRAAVEARYPSRGVAANVLDYLDSLPDNVSAVNVVEEARLLRLQELGQELATRMASGKHDERTRELLEVYANTAELGVTGGERQWRLTPEDFGGVSGQRLPIAPRILNSKIRGGVLRGHNVTVYARPDCGKSLFVLNQSAFALRQGRKVLYVANEEPSQDITRRLLARLTGTSIEALDSESAMRDAMTKVETEYERWYLLHEAGCTAGDVTAAAAQVEPDFIIVDQLKNLSVPEDNRALQLDRVAREIRQIGIKRKAVTISVTQAGESAAGKRVLDMSDVEWSNTGIPGAADLMIGIGANEDDLACGRRTISLAKNKISGWHGSFPVWIEPLRTAFSSRRGS